MTVGQKDRAKPNGLGLRKKNENSGEKLRGEKHETHSHHNFYTHESTTYFDRRKE